MKIAFAQERPRSAAVIVAGVLAGRKLTPAAAELDRMTGGALRRVADAPGFGGKHGEIVELLAPAGMRARRIVLAGLGDPAELTPLAAQEVGGAIAAHLAEVGEAEAAVDMDAAVSARSARRSPLAPGELPAHIAFGAVLRGYRFDRYRSVARPDLPVPLTQLMVIAADARATLRFHAHLDAVAKGVTLARDLVNEPSNVLYPESFVERAKGLRRLGIAVEALDEARMRRLGMGALLAVGQGSARTPRLLVLRWPGAGKGKAARAPQAPLAFVGKGVTFDTGGIDIKPAAGMEEMKGDMAGGAVVVGLLAALAARNSPTPAVGVVPLVENMPSGRAYRPGDIVRTMAGQTIEVIDTDSEGRMILVDVLHYTVSRFKPRLVVDLATLTYSVVKALGRVFAGMLSNDDALAERLIAAGRDSGERVWRLPLDPAYDENLKSDVADIRQFAPDDESADCVHAAQLLQRFVGATPWAHLDIAGVEFLHKATKLAPAGASGYGVRLLDRFVAAQER